MNPAGDLLNHLTQIRDHQLLRLGQNANLVTARQEFSRRVASEVSVGDLMQMGDRFLKRIGDATSDKEGNDESYDQRNA